MATVRALRGDWLHLELPALSGKVRIQYETNYRFRIISAEVLNCSQIQSVRNEDDADDCIQFYRAIQVLEKYFNACPHIKRIIPLTVFITPTLQIITQYVCISLRDAVPLPGFLVFPLIAADTIINNVLILTLGSGVHSGSQKALQLLNRRKQRGLKPDRIIRRKVKSCSLLKIRFGSNFIDRGTPLVIQDFCMGQTVNLILINSGWILIWLFLSKVKSIFYNIGITY